MPTILVASDSREVREQIQTALVRPGFNVVQAERGQDVVPYVAEAPPDLVILDMQIGNMGGVATALELRLEESADRCEHVSILLLLDREADRFLADRSEVEAFLVKPYDPGTLRRTVKRLLDEAEASVEHADPTVATGDGEGSTGEGDVDKEDEADAGIDAGIEETPAAP